MPPERVRLGPGPEFDLIRRFLPHAPTFGRSDVAVGPGDDCAVVLGEGVAISTDLSVEEIHFRRGWLSSHEIGFRAAASALSDLAAVAARPIGVLCSIGIEEDEVDDIAVDLMDGIREAAQRSDAVVLGGDLTRSPGPIIVDVTVVGAAANPILRSGATPGDSLWVTGELGAAAVAVARLSRNERVEPGAYGRYARPDARVREASWLADRGLPTSMIDLSDGLAGDASHVSAASRAALVFDRDRLPVHTAVRRETSTDRHALDFVLAGGEDYELLFSAPAERVEPLADEFRTTFGVGLTRIGRVEDGEGIWWSGPGGSRETIDETGYQHFDSRP